MLTSIAATHAPDAVNDDARRSDSAGDGYRMRSGGGGGYGDPRERPAAAVAEDVRQGYVSAKAAKELYGVVVDVVTGAVDEKGTRR